MDLAPTRASASGFVVAKADEIVKDARPASKIARSSSASAPRDPKAEAPCP
jgi:hypothetical protein